jgi:hypothetical protein
MTTKSLERQVSRVFSPRAHCGLNATGANLANSKIFGRDIAVWVFAPEELRGLDRDGFHVAIGARFAVNEDFELSARWTKLPISPILFRHGGAPRFAHNVYVFAHPACWLHGVIADGGIAPVDVRLGNRAAEQRAKRCDW